jgi:hypothetical protein
MKKLKLLTAVMALTLMAQAHAAGANFTDIQVDTLTPKSGEPITFSFTGVTDPSCMIKISTNVSAFSLEGGAPVQNGKLSFVPSTAMGPMSDGFTMTLSQGIFNSRCEGPGKTFNVQINASRIGNVGAETNVVAQGKPVNILVGGIDYKSCDGAALDFGDGTPPQQISGGFPIKTSHVYAQAGVYKQSVKATGATCYGSAVSQFNTTVQDATAMTKITGMQLAYANTEKTGAKITVGGSPGGTCERAFVNWGDGSSPEPVSGNFPLSASHAYPNGGNQTIKVAAADGFKCLGQAQAVLYTYPAQAKFTGVTPAVSTAAINQEITLELAGTGICQNVSVALGDNLNTISVGAVNFSPYNNFKWPVKVKYAKGGSYTLYVKDNGASGCGILTPKVTVGEPVQFNPVLVMPAGRPAVPVVAVPVMPAAKPAVPVMAAPPPPLPKPKPLVPAKPCAKKNGQQIDPGCVDN